MFDLVSRIENERKKEDNFHFEKKMERPSL